MPTNGSTDDNGGSTQISKVVRVIQNYGLTGMGEELVASWTGRDGERRSLRDLAKHINHEILRTTMANAGMNPLAGEVENMYRLLTQDEISSGMQIEAERTLKQNGIDVDQLIQDFVSHQAVHTYLTKYRGIDSPTDTTDQNQIEKTVDTIQRLQNRLSAVGENCLQSLHDTGRISLGDFNILIDIRVFCTECGTQSDFVDFLRNGGCTCED